MSTAIPRFLMTFALFVVACSFSVTACADDEISFEPANDFPKLPDGWTLGPCSAVAVNSKGEIFLFHRGKHPILCFAPNGMYLRSWGDRRDLYNKLFKQ